MTAVDTSNEVTDRISRKAFFEWKELAGSGVCNMADWLAIEANAITRGLYDLARLTPPELRFLALNYNTLREAYGENEDDPPA